MHNYFTGTIEPDIEEVLSIKPKGTFTERMVFDQLSTQYDDESSEVISHNDQVIFEVEIPIKTLTETDAETVFDLYFNLTKTNGIENSFTLEHPTDGYSYITKFNNTYIDRKILNSDWIEYGTINLLILGNAPVSIISLLIESGYSLLIEDGISLQI